MPSDEAYESVLRALGEMADAWRSHRESVNRAIGMLADEVFQFEKRLNKDDQSRAERQQVLDAKLQSIEDGQERIQRWQRARIVIEVVAILLALAYWYGASR